MMFGQVVSSITTARKDLTRAIKLEKTRNDKEYRDIKRSRKSSNEGRQNRNQHWQRRRSKHCIGKTYSMPRGMVFT